MGLIEEANETVSQTLATWHDAAARADEELFFSMMTDTAMFVGTDDGEVWNPYEFRAAAREAFEAAPVWSFRQRRVHAIWPDTGIDDVIWFVELLDSDELGLCRGSGAIERHGDSWKIALYVLSCSVPNEHYKAVQRAIGGSQ